MSIASLFVGKRQSGVTLLAIFLAHFFAFATGLPAPSEEGPRYDISLDIDFSAGTFFGTETIDYLNRTGERLGEIFLRFYPNAPPIYGDGFLAVEEVLVNGDPVETKAVMNNTALMIFFPAPIDPGEWVSLKLQFRGLAALWEGSSAVGYGTYAASARTMTLATFYPLLAVYDEEGWNIDPIGEIGDAVFSEAASYTVRVTADPGLVLLSSGRCVEEWKEGDRRAHRFFGEGMRDFIIVVGKKYAEQSETVGDLVLRTSFFPEHVHAREIAMRKAKAALEFYQRRFGPFAYDELDLVETPLARAAGVEFPGLVLIAESYCTNPFDRFFDVIIAHEVAHQWWYGAVGNDVIEEPWLDEALATYTSALFLEEVYGAEAARATIAEWEAAYKAARERYPGLSIASPLHQFPDSATYSAFVYSGGALFLDEIRRRIGDAAFFEALSSYYRDHAYKIARGTDLCACFVAVCACDLSEVFTDYLEP